MPSRRHVLALLGRNAAGLAAVSALGPALARGETAEPDIYKGHGMAMHGDLKYPAGFAHFDYANPNAPKGGAIYFGAGGATFDSLNPFILKGSPVTAVMSYVFDTLMKSSQDEPFSKYGLVAKTIETPKDRAWVAFELDERARFHDGSPITADDVVFSFETLTGDKAHPRLRQYYYDVVKVEKTGPHAVKFTFRAAGNRELPLIVGELPILPKAYWAARPFDQVTLEKPLGSGAYKVGDVSPGRYVVFERVKNYWADDLPVNRGHDNFDIVRVDFFRDQTVSREAFKAGEFDFVSENQALAWATQYEGEAFREGRAVKREIKHERPAGMQCFVMNTRRAQFKDWRVRRALTLLFDFEWINRNYFFGLYARAAGFFAGSELSAYGRPADDREREFLRPFAERIRPDILDGSYRLPVTDGSGRDRTTLRSALKLLSEAGYELDGTVLRQRATKIPFTFEILVTTRDQERIALAYQRDLKRAGIEASVRAVDPVQFDQRRLGYEFDMLQNRWDQSLSPGNEQSFYFGSQAADIPGTRNYMGAKEPAIDALIAALLEARERPAFVSAVRALDRALISGFYAIPVINVQEQWIARWNRIEQPVATALTGYLPETWWQRPETK